MPSKTLDDLPEIFVSNTEISSSVTRAVELGNVRQIGPKLYTKNLKDAPETIVRRHVWLVVAAFAPGALIADRTALENAPAADGSVFIVSNRKRDLALPGLTIRPRKGPAPLPGDLPFIGGLYLSSTARAFLDNMAPSRRRNGNISRTLNRAEIETRLDDLIRRNGAESVNNLRDEAKRIAPLIEREAEFAALDKLIGALLGTRDEEVVTEQGRARKSGQPFDPDRVLLFERLHKELRANAPGHRPARERNATGRATLAFFEAYFSNFIEGTEFDVGEAADIVFRNVIPRDRPQDAHDVLGTWRIVSDATQMSRTPRDAATLNALMKSRHATLMAARPDKLLGTFKTAINRAGNTVFVSPENVEGTLARGFEYYQSLETPLARAIFMMFLVSEVHPFTDGNGRIARIMMNAELSDAGEERIIIPTIFRTNYLSALKAMSLSQNPSPLLRTLDFAQKWVASIAWGELSATQAELARTNAFMDSGEADDVGVRLRISDGMP